MDLKSKNMQFLEVAKKLTYRKRYAFTISLLTSIQKAKQGKFTNKPNGLWYSFGDAWISFLTENYNEKTLRDNTDWGKIRIDTYNYIYHLTIDYDKVVKIRNEREFKTFENKYRDGHFIDWKKVQSKFHGIEIRYLKDIDEEWYEGWDVSSGCIWHPEAVISAKLIDGWTPNFRNVCSYF